MNRRGFLQAMLAAAAAPAIVKAGSLMPLGRVWALSAGGILTLVGDGITDDTAALQAFVNGGRVAFADGTPFTGMLRGGSYLITSTINVTEKAPVTLSDGKIIGRMTNPNDAMIHIHNGAADQWPLPSRLWLERP